MVPIPQDKRNSMTSVLLQECHAHVLQDIVKNMDNIEWQRFFRSLTGASSAQGVLTQKQWSVLDAVQRGGEMLEGTTFRRASREASGDEEPGQVVAVAPQQQLHGEEN